MKRHFVVMGFLVLHVLCFSQNQVTDSLRVLLKSTNTDSTRITALNELSTLSRKSGNYDSALYYAKQALAITDAQIVVYKKGRAKSFNSIGNVYNMQGNWPESLKNYFACLKLMEETGDKRGIAAAYGNIGNVLYYQNNLKEALKNHFAALKIKEELKDRKGMVVTYNNIANVYINQSKYPEALKIFSEVLKIIEETRLPDGQIADKRGKSIVCQGLGNIYYYENNFQKAFENYEAALKLQEAIGDKQGIANSLVNMGGACNKLKRPEEALLFCNKGLELAREIEVPEIVKEAHETLSQTYETLGGAGSTVKQRGYMKKALEYYKAYIASRDSLLNEENTKKMVRTQMNYEFDKKESAAKLEEEKKEAIAATESRRQKIILFVLSGFGILALGFALFAYRSFLQKQKANIAITTQKNLIEEKQKEILDSIHYARRIQRALLPGEKYIERNLEKRNRL